MPTVRQRDVPPEVWAKLMAAAAEQIAPAAESAADEPEAKPQLVPAAFVPPGTWLVPIATASETNSRDWRKRSNRTKAARLAISRAIGPNLDALAVFALHYHASGVLRVKFTRLAGRKLDASNLPAALKATEDALALMLGADDGDPRWCPEFGQEPGAATGVRIEIESIDPK